MAKGVLGNDPFQRGAAPRAPQLAPAPTQVPTEQGEAAKPPKRFPARPTGRTRGGGAAVRGWKTTSGPNLGKARPPPSTGRDPIEAIPERRAQPSPTPLGSAREAADGLREVVKGLFRAARTALGAVSPHLDDFGQDPDLVQQLSPIADFLYDRYWRVAVDGADALPEGPAILVANHSGALPLDGPVLRMAIQRRRPDLREARWLLEDPIFYLPVLGLLLNRIGAVRASADNALRLLTERRPLIVFPEGVHGISKTFNDRYQLRPFGRGGFIKIALRTGAPILPVAIVGAEESMPVLAKIPANALGLSHLPLTLPPLPAKWIIRFGAPIQLPGGISESDATEVQQWAEHTRRSIQEMLRGLLAARRSAFTG